MTMSSLGLFNPASLALNNKFLPVHCVVARDECPQGVLQDGFVIVPAQTKFHEIVSVVLRTMEADVGKIEQDERADGQILIKNWNPLPIPTVTENRTVTVQEILGDLMNVAILKIRISKYSNAFDEKRSARLLKQLMPLVNDERDKHELVSKLNQVMHNDIEENDDDDDDDDDDDRVQQNSFIKPTTSPNGYSLTSSNSNTNDGDNIPLNLSTKSYPSTPSISHSINSSKSFLNYPFASLLSLAQQQHHHHHHHQQHHPPPQTYDPLSLHSSPTIKDYPYNRRQRERTTFDPHEETPRLLQIFTDTKHPTRYQIASICESLNALPCRKGKKALEPYNIQYWFKNARAALKRKKRRFTPSENVIPPVETEEYPSEPTHGSAKVELDSSEELEDEEDDDEEEGGEENHVDLNEKTSSVNNAKNYYFNYLQAFDISLPDHPPPPTVPLLQQQQQRSKGSQSDESLDEDNISSISEQTPPTQIKKISTFDYNRSRRNRIFIDPTSEVPKLEQWFAIETHPDHVLIERICSELNEGEYRSKFPKLESKHIRLWFKNHRAKVKRICRIRTTTTTTAAMASTEETNETHLHNVQ